MSAGVASPVGTAATAGEAVTVHFTPAHADANPLRRAVGAATGIPASDVVLGRGRHGAPRVLTPSGLWASVSHGGGLDGVALSGRGPVGLDLEPVRAFDVDEVVRLRLDAADAAYIDGLPADERLVGFLAVWTAKEALLKALGKGLSIPPAAVRLSFGPHGPDGVLAVGGNPAAARHWDLQRLALDGYVATLVTRRSPTAPGP